jgi:DnaK suppressor protein
MTNSEMSSLKAALEARMAAITDNGSKREDIVIQQAPDSFDAVQLNSERDLTIALLNHETLQLRNLRGALHRIEDGSYGTCVQCEEEISPKRLKAVPWAMLCLSCQEEADRAQAAGEIEAGSESTR